MYYELYIDIFFLVNFMMDYMMLSVTGRMLRCTATHGRICLGAALGALGTCIVVALPIPHMFIKFILFHGVVNILMIKTGLKVRWDRTFFKAYLLLYISGFLLGGVFTYFHRYVRYAGMFFAFAVISYYLVLGIWSLVSYLARQENYRCDVMLYQGGRALRVTAVIDTGNALKDPVTAQPVSILDQKAAKDLCGGDRVKGIRFIPYHSIGKAEGVMPLIRLDRMEVLKREHKVIENPYVAVCEEPVSADGYEMILNPDIL